MDMTIPELLIQDGFITAADKVKMDDFSSRSGLSFIKIALNFGYISRKNYERSLSQAGYIFAQVRDEAFDKDVLKNRDDSNRVWLSNSARSKIHS